jgi:cysteine-rich repeat protein
MRHPQLLSGLLTLGLLCLCGPAWAQVEISFNPRLFTLSQPGMTPVVIPAVETLSTAEQFYSYSGGASNTGLEASNRSLLLLHRDVRAGRGELSLLITHGSAGLLSLGLFQTNISVNMDIAGLPAQVVIARSDDQGELTKPTATTARGRWLFNQKTDGGLLTGFPDDEAWSVTITPQIGAQLTEWRYYFANEDFVALDRSAPVTLTYAPSLASLNGAAEALEGSPLRLCAIAYTQERGVFAPALNYSWQWSASESSTGQTGDKELFCGEHTWLQDGVAEVQVHLVQGAQVASRVIPVTIRNVPPTVAALPAQGVEGQPLELIAQATDPGADTLFYRWDVDGDGLWDTERAASPSYTVLTPHYATTRYRVGVFDGEAEVVAEGQVAVQNVAPSLDPIADAEIRSARAWTLTAAAQDPGGASRLTWSLLQAPAGVTVTNAGVLSWRPTIEQRGLHELQLQVSDGALTAARTFRLLVNDCGTSTLELGEHCDDGNRAAQDGCNSDCRLEPGYLCLIPGQPCEKLPDKDHKGKEFIFGFITNYQDNYGTKEVHLTGEHATEVLIEYPVVNPTFTQRITIDPSTVQVVALPASSDATGAVRLSAQKEFITYMINRGPYTSDAGVALPVDVLGKEYVVAAVPGYWGGKTAAQGVIVGIYDNTTVQVGAQTITLQRGQDHRVLGNDKIGTWISADRPVAVTSGTGCANVPTSNVAACDTVFQMVPPTQAWGTTVPVGPLPDRPGGSLYQVYAAEDGTQVYQDNASLVTLNRGQYRAVGPVAGPHLFTANKPIYVVQYMTGKNSAGATTGDPMMLSVSPAEQFIKQYTFSTVGGGQFAQHYLQIYAPADAVGQLTLDGAVVDPALFEAIPGTDLRVALVVISEGVHTTSSPKPHAVATIGLNGFDSYGYTGGALFAVLSVADGNPPLCALTQSSPSQIHGVASDDRPSEDTNQNGQLDDGEDVNQNNALDRDTGLVNLSLLGELDVTWETTFTPGDADASFQITSNDPRRFVQGAVLVLDGVGNAAVCAFTLAPDSDGDGIFDRDDADSDNDGVPDRDELPAGLAGDADHDDDGWPNWRDPQAPGFLDRDGDGVDDRMDRDGDGVPDHIDLDADGDGVPDLAERLDPALDADGDGRLDDVADADQDGLADLADADPSDPDKHSPRWLAVDTDGDGVPDHLDTDSDNDGRPDLIEVGLSDADGDGRADGADADGDGLADALDPDQGGAPAPRIDTDGDGAPDLRDGDDDDDGVHSAIEGQLGTDSLDADSDGDGIGDFVETDDGERVDTDGDGVIDALDPDSDNDTLSDALEGAGDSDGDGVGDWRDFDCQPGWEGQACALPGLGSAPAPRASPAAALAASPAPRSPLPPPRPATARTTTATAPSTRRSSAPVRPPAAAAPRPAPPANGRAAPPRSPSTRSATAPTTTATAPSTTAPSAAASTSPRAPPSSPRSSGPGPPAPSPPITPSSSPRPRSPTSPMTTATASSTRRTPPRS